MSAIGARRGVLAVACAIAGLAPRTAVAHPRRCSEVSTIVGDARCQRFGGRWSLPGWVPTFTLDLGLVGHRLDTDPETTSDRRAGTTSQVVTPPRAVTLSAIAVSVGVNVTLRGRFYTGPEVELGRLVAGPTAWRAAAPDGPGSFAPYFAARWIIGVRINRGSLMLAIEIAGGVRGYGFAVGARDAGPFGFQERGALDGRARVSYWLVPWVEVGASLGTSLIDRGDRSLGVFIAPHSRTFGGRRR